VSLNGPGVGGGGSGDEEPLPQPVKIKPVHIPAISNRVVLFIYYSCLYKFGQSLSNKNKSATVAKTQNFCELNKA
jgi:hypothetical protein